MKFHKFNKYEIQNGISQCSEPGSVLDDITLSVHHSLYAAGHRVYRVSEGGDVLGPPARGSF